MAEQWDAKNKSFVITGGSSGLSLECIKVFLGLQAKCIAVVDFVEEIDRTYAKHSKRLQKQNVIFIKCNGSKDADITNAFKQVLSQFKQIDVIINIVDDIKKEKLNLWRTDGVIKWEQLVSSTIKGMKYMRKDKGGRGGAIVNILSTATLTEFPFIPVYNGSKMVLLHFNQCITMAPFYEDTEVRILTMSFEPKDTYLTHNLKNGSNEENITNDVANTTVVNAVKHQKMKSPVLDFVDMDNGWCDLIIS